MCIRWGRLRPLLTSIFLVCVAVPAGAVDWSELRPHLTFNLASHHAGATQRYNEKNTGLGFGLNVPSDSGNWRYGVELGWYRNSNYQTSAYAVATTDRRVASLAASTDLSVGLVAGLAHYHGGAEGFGKKGIPTLGDWILAGGGSVSIRHNDRTELRMGIHPAPDIADVLLTFQIRVNL